MNKKLVAVAVAGLFGAPAAALAQSSVTISGQIKGGYENLKLGDSNRAAGVNNTSQHGVVDDSSALRFNVVEDLGGGLQAIVQLDFRPSIDGGVSNNATGASGGAFGATGNTHIGLRSKSWGRIFFGRQDLHYFNTSSYLTDKGSLRASSNSLLSYAGAWATAAQRTAGTGINSVGIASASRTPNVVHYTTPNWGGFTAILAYSSNPVNPTGNSGIEQDLNVPATQASRKGGAWNFQPNYAASNWQVGYSYWKSKPDAATATTTPGSFGTANQRGDRVYGEYTFAMGLRIGLAWDHSRLEGAGGPTTSSTLSKRTAWSVPVRYEFMGKHSINGHYTWAKDDKAQLADGLNTGSKMWAISYAYDLSKRTSVAITYAQIKNESNAIYNVFASTSLGLSTGGVSAGEDPKIWGTTLRHAF